MKESVGRDEGQNCSKSLRGRRSAKESETSPAESALRIAPVCKEPPASREQGPRDHRVTVLIYSLLPKARKITGLGLYGTRRSASTVRQVQPAEKTIESAARENASVRTPIGGRSIARAATREPVRAWITGGGRGGDGEQRSGEREVTLRFYLKSHDDC